MPSNPNLLPAYYIALILILLLYSLISVTDAAFASVNINVLFHETDEESDPRSKRAADILKSPLRMQFTNALLHGLLLAGGVYLCAKLPSYDFLITVIFLALMIGIGEIFARKLAIQHSYSLLIRLSAFQYLLILAFTPLTLLLSGIANLFLLLFRQKIKIDLPRYSEEEIMSLLEAGQETGEIKEEGKKMINSIFAFDDELAYEIMTPRTDVFMIDINDDPKEYMDELMELRYSRIPVYKDDSDNILGILHIKDYLIKAREVGFDQVDIASILRQAYFVPETKNIDSLFFELQKEKQHIAVLIDEYGGFSGIVTMEDIIEEVMGEINDEYDQEEQPTVMINDNVYIVNGNDDLDDLNEDLGTDLESDNSETLGGLIIELLGEIPDERDINRQISYKQYRFSILSVKDRRIDRVKMQIMRPEKGEKEPVKEETGSGGNL